VFGPPVYDATVSELPQVSLLPSTMPSGGQWAVCAVARDSLGSVGTATVLAAVLRGVALAGATAAASLLVSAHPSWRRGGVLASVNDCPSVEQCEAVLLLAIHVPSSDAGDACTVLQHTLSAVPVCCRDAPSACRCTDDGCAWLVCR
jgi:hypothetical protein